MKEEQLIAVSDIYSLILLQWFRSVWRPRDCGRRVLTEPCGDGGLSPLTRVKSISVRKSIPLSDFLC